MSQVIYESEWGLYALAPTALTAKKGIHIFLSQPNSDDLQYSVGSASLNSAVLTENWNTAQLTIRCWVRLNDIGASAYFVDSGGPVSDTVNRIRLWRISSLIRFYVYDKDGTSHYVQYNISGWSIDEWHQIVAVLDFNNDRMELYTDGTSRDNTPADNALSSDSIDAITSTTSIGQWQSVSPTSDNTRQLNGVTTFQFYNRAWTDAEVAADYASAAGTPFVCDPDTIAMGKYSDSDTGAVYWHKGQKISSISTVTITVAEAVGSRSWANGKAVVAQDDDNPPNIVRTTINGTPSGSTIVLTDSAAAVTGTNKYVTMNLVADGDMELGNTGAYAAGDGGTTISKSTTQIKKDTQSLKILNGDGTQAFARQTITTVANADYWFHGWFYAPATANGASMLVDVDANAALGVTVTLAGLSAGWNEIEFSFAADDASTTIDLGSGSVTNTEFGYWDSVEIRENLADNPGIEGGADPPASWVQEGSATVTSDTSPHSGTNCLKAIAGAANVGASQAVTLVSGKYYTITGWAKATAADTAEITMDKGDTTTFSVGTVTATSWTQVQATFLSTGTSGVIYLRGVVNGDVVWFDDLSIIQVDEAAASTATKGSGYIPLGNPIYIA